MFEHGANFLAKVPHSVQPHPLMDIFLFLISSLSLSTVYYFSSGSVDEGAGRSDMFYDHIPQDFVCACWWSLYYIILSVDLVLLHCLLI